MYYIILSIKFNFVTKNNKCVLSVNNPQFTVLYTTLQYSTVLYSIAQHITVQCSSLCVMWIGWVSSKC